MEKESSLGMGVECLSLAQAFDFLVGNDHGLLFFALFFFVVVRGKWKVVKCLVFRELPVSRSEETARFATTKCLPCTAPTFSFRKANQVSFRAPGFVNFRRGAPDGSQCQQLK